MNKTQKKVSFLTVALLVFESFAGGAYADITVTIQEEAGNTRMTVSGSVNTSGLAGPFGTTTFTNDSTEVFFSSGSAQMQPLGSTMYTTYTGGTFSSSFSGTPLDLGFFNFAVDGGPAVFLGISSGGQVRLPSGYVSGTDLDDSFLALFTPAQHGFEIGDTVSSSWVFNTVSQSITFEVIASAPEPTPLPSTVSFSSPKSGSIVVQSKVDCDYRLRRSESLSGDGSVVEEKAGDGSELAFDFDDNESGATEAFFWIEEVPGPGR